MTSCSRCSRCMCRDMRVDPLRWLAAHMDLMTCRLEQWAFYFWGRGQMPPDQRSPLNSTATTNKTTEITYVRLRSNSWLL